MCAQQRSRHLAAVPELAIALLFFVMELWPVGSSCVNVLLETLVFWGRALDDRKNTPLLLV